MMTRGYRGECEWLVGRQKGESEDRVSLVQNVSCCLADMPGPADFGARFSGDRG